MYIQIHTCPFIYYCHDLLLTDQEEKSMFSYLFMYCTHDLVHTWPTMISNPMPDVVHWKLDFDPMSGEHEFCTHQ